MNAATLAAYRKLRRVDGCSPASALHHARKNPIRIATGGTWLPPVDDGAKFTRGQFDCVVSVEQDECQDYSYLGEYADAATPGAILRPSHQYHAGQPVPRCREYCAVLPARTAAEHYKDLRAMGYSRVVAREEASEMVRRAVERLDRLSDHWTYLVVGVVAYRDGVKLGSCYIGGVESDCGQDYLAEVVADATDNAIAEAKETLSHLCASRTEEE